MSEGGQWLCISCKSCSIYVEKFLCFYWAVCISISEFSFWAPVPFVRLTGFRCRKSGISTGPVTVLLRSIFSHWFCLELYCRSSFSCSLILLVIFALSLVQVRRQPDQLLFRIPGESRPCPIFLVFDSRAASRLTGLFSFRSKATQVPHKFCGRFQPQMPARADF
jgi:hypothetical protein